MKLTRVFLADDHAVVREGVKTLINSQADMEVVGEAADGESALLGVAKTAPDVLVVDITMPRLNGARAAVQVRAAHPGVRIVALTMHESRGYLRELLSAGASGYVLKRTLVERQGRFPILLHLFRPWSAFRTRLDYPFESLPQLVVATGGGPRRRQTHGQSKTLDQLDRLAHGPC